MISFDLSDEPAAVPVCTSCSTTVRLIRPARSTATPCRPLLPGTGAGLGPCEPRPGPQRMRSGGRQHVERVCFDLGRLTANKESVSGTVSVCLWVIDSPFTAAFYPSARLFLDFFYYDMLWCVSETVLFGNDMISSSPDENHIAHCTTDIVVHPSHSHMHPAFHLYSIV